MVRPVSEFSFIDYLKKKIPKPGSVSVGIGDDAAVLDFAAKKQLVISADVIVEHVDFTIKTLSPEKIGRKALAVNLSDIAAMGASPTAFVVSIGKPSYIAASWLKRFYNGLLLLAKQYNVPCVGGDFSSSKEFFASVTIIGEASKHRIIRRTGAMPGDWIAVTGALGGSLLRHHNNFTPRVREGLFLASRFTPSSMIDISDGLVQDLSHVLEASKAGAVLDIDKIPVSLAAKKMAKGNSRQALLRALSDGEDFELLFTVSPWKKMTLGKIWKRKFPGVPLTWIGKIEGKVPRIVWRQEGRKVLPPKLVRNGYSHF